MVLKVKKNTCYTCKYFKEGSYKYYTDDNRIIECYRTSCQKQLYSQKEENRPACIGWELKKGDYVV